MEWSWIWKQKWKETILWIWPSRTRSVTKRDSRNWLDSSAITVCYGVSWCSWALGPHFTVNSSNRTIGSIASRSPWSETVRETVTDMAKGLSLRLEESRGLSLWHGNEAISPLVYFFGEFVHTYMTVWNAADLDCSKSWDLDCEIAWVVISITFTCSSLRQRHSYY